MEEPVPTHLTAPPRESSLEARIHSHQRVLPVSLCKYQNCVFKILRGIMVSRVSVSRNIFTMMLELQRLQLSSAPNQAFISTKTSLWLACVLMRRPDSSLPFQCWPSSPTSQSWALPHTCLTLHSLNNTQCCSRFLSNTRNCRIISRMCG